MSKRVSVAYQLVKNPAKKRVTAYGAIMMPIPDAAVVGSTSKIRTMQGKVVSTENCAARTRPEMDRGTVKRSPAEAHGVSLSGSASHMGSALTCASPDSSTCRHIGIVCDPGHSTLESALNNRFRLSQSYKQAGGPVYPVMGRLPHQCSHPQSCQARRPARRELEEWPPSCLRNQATADTEC